MPVLGRWSMVYLCFASNYARKEGLGSLFVGKTGWREFIIATGITGIISLVFGFKGLVILGAVFIWSVLCRLFFKKKIGGITGDVLGASNEISEIIFLLVACVLFG